MMTLICILRHVHRTDDLNTEDAHAMTLGAKLRRTHFAFGDVVHQGQDLALSQSSNILEVDMNNSRTFCISDVLEILK